MEWKKEVRKSIEKLSHSKEIVQQYILYGTATYYVLSGKEILIKN